MRIFPLLLVLRLLSAVFPGISVQVFLFLLCFLRLAVLLGMFFLLLWLSAPLHFLSVFLLPRLFPVFPVCFLKISLVVLFFFLLVLLKAVFQGVFFLRIFFRVFLVLSL